jgi:hypothetical protein
LLSPRPTPIPEDQASVFYIPQRQGIKFLDTDGIYITTNLEIYAFPVITL